MDRKQTTYYVLYQPSSNNCSAVVSYMAGYFKSAGKYYTSVKDLEIGDIVFFQNSKGLSHVGICVDWSDTKKTITTIEGNHNDKVDYGTYNYSDFGGYIAGLGKPRYTDDLTRKAALAYAKSQVGYTEGSNNWNKYADELDKIDYFAGCGKKQNLPWCAVFICAVMYNAYSVQAEPAPEPTPAPTTKDYTVSVNSFLTIRNGAGTSYKELGRLYNGAVVSVFEVKGEWSRIGGNLWVCNNYLK